MDLAIFDEIKSNVLGLSHLDREIKMFFGMWNPLNDCFLSDGNAKGNKTLSLLS